MKHGKLGFTILELMLVIAIVGVLAAIAIPIYQDYRVRANITEAMQRAGSLKNAVAEYYFTNDEFPDTMADMGLEDEVDPTRNVSLVHINDRYICIHMRNTGAPEIDGAAHPIRLQPIGDGATVSWLCGHSGAVPDGYFAQNCRNHIESTSAGG
ncbi:MAG: pilin [Arenimonas sp.]